MTLPTNPPTSCWPKVEYKLAQMVWNTPSWEAFSGVADDSRVWVDAWPRPTNKDSFTDVEWASYFPNAVVSTAEEEGSATFVLEGAPMSFNFSGMLQVCFEAYPDPAQEVFDQNQNFKDAVGAIIDDMLSMIDDSRYLWFREATLVEIGRSQYTDHQSLGDFLRATWMFPHGSIESAGAGGAT